MRIPFVTAALRRAAAGPARANPPLRAAEEKASRVGRLLAFPYVGKAVWTPRDYAARAREGFMRNAIVYRAVRMIAEAAASVPRLLYDGAAEVDEHPLLKLLAQPNRRQAGADFREAVVGYLLTAGNAYIEAVAVDGAPRELYALRPDRMKVVPGTDGWPEAYEYAVAGQTVRFTDPGEGELSPVLQLALFHPLDDHYGFAPVEAAAYALDTHNAAAAWNKALLDNSARPSGALVYSAKDGGNLSSEQYERLKGELETGFTGAARAGRPLLLEGGLDWKTMSLTPKDMDFPEAKNAAAREVALAFGVPPMLLGIPGDNTYANYKEANAAFWRGTVLPLTAKIAGALSEWLTPAYGEGLRLWFDPDQVDALSGDREALWARIAAADGGTGDMRFVIDKEADGDTASFVFQSAWSGRAEIGLAGDTDLVMKVSADGSTWTEAVRIDKTSGHATILYDNATSGLTATNVQAAIDEIAASGGGGGGGGAVASVFGRTGAVVAATSDYDASQVDNDSGVSGATVKAALDTLSSGKQAASGDLAAIAGLSPANDDVLQRKAGAWTSRTPAQLKADLAVTASDIVAAVSNTEFGYLDGVTSAIQTQLNAKAALASPKLTGTPTAPTAAVDTSTTQLATTAFVVGQASASGDGTPAGDGTAARGTSTHFARADHVHPTDTSRAALASPTFTGTPAAPTATGGTNTTQLATTAFVTAAVAALSTVYQAIATILTAIAALATTGLIVRTGSGTVATRTITGTASRIAVTNGDGVAGDPTLDVGTDIASLSTAAQSLSGGARVVTYDNGTKSSGTFTPDPGNGPNQKATNNGAHTLAPGTNYGSYYLDITNGASAGAITTSGWTKVDGDSFTTTNTNKFKCVCTISEIGSTLTVKAMQ